MRLRQGRGPVAWVRLGLLAAAVAGNVVLGGCATPAAPLAMATGAAASMARQHPHSVSVSTSGGSETGAMDSSNISDADLKTAIERSITESRLFTSLAQGAGAPYALSVSLVQMRKPIFGVSFTVELEMGWTFVRTGDRQVLLRKVLTSSGTATFGEAFAGVTRLRMAVERAAQNNIRQGLEEIAALTL